MNKPALEARAQLEALANAPIVGQPFKIVSYFNTVLIQCNCDAQTPLLLVGRSAATCPACQKRFAIGEQGQATIGQVAPAGVVHG